MGTSSSNPLLDNQPPPEKLSDFKQLAIAPQQYNIPELPHKRTITDKKCLIFFASSFTLLFIFLIYTLQHSDPRRYINGYDSCGNICGVKNEYVSGVKCSGKDMTANSYLLVNHPLDISEDNVFYYKYTETNKCVESCVPYENEIEDSNETDVRIYTGYSHNCLSPGELHYSSLLDFQNNFIDFGIEFSQYFGHTILLAVLSIGLCLILFLLFKYWTGIMIWGIISVCYGLLIILTLSFWIGGDKLGAFILTVVSIVITIIIKISAKRISLVIALFREASKAIFSMPLILFEPLLTSAAWIITFILFLKINERMSSAGILTNIQGPFYTYEQTGGMVFAIIFNIILTVWMLNFIVDCQVMIISGAVSTWYFSSDKTFLGNPIKTSLMNLVKYHLGSVALGSLLLTSLGIFKMIIKRVTKYERLRFLTNYFLNWLESFLIYISTNAYIEIAMHGESFLRSGKRAIRLLHMNLSDVLVLQFTSNFIIFMLKLIVVIIIIYFEELTRDEPLSSFRSLLLTAILAHHMFLLYGITINTIFLCYCEDCLINDGEEKPYYMSNQLMQFFHESKTILAAEKTDHLVSVEVNINTNESSLYKKGEITEV